jgi:hypothetical protein
MPHISLQNALDLLDDLTVDELKRMNPAQLTFITTDLSGEDKLTFFFKKNVKIFGGINGYVDDFFRKFKVKELTRSDQLGALEFLKKMKETTGLTDDNKRRVSHAISVIEGQNSAPSAGGGKRRKTKKRRRASSK